MRRLRILCVILIALVALIVPDVVFAQSATDPGPQYNIQIEYRYTKGEESKLNIPDSISRYGRTYHLVSKAAPVLEKKLPATRVYTWYVDGTITQDEMGLVDGMKDVNLTPTTVTAERVVDETAYVTGLATNDVEALPLTKTYPEGVLTRAAVRFDVETQDDFGLPTTYKAEIIYRGVETYTGPGYKVTATYTTSESLAGVPVYVVVATFAPDGIVGTTTGGTTTGGTTTTPTGTSTGDTTTSSPVVIPPIDNVPDQTVTPDQSTIPDTTTPTNPGTTPDQPKAGPNPWMIAAIIFAVCLAVFFVWLLLARRRVEREKEAMREEKRREALRAQGLTEYDG